MVIVVGVMPGADAVRAALELPLLLLLPPELGVELELLLEHAATASALTVIRAAACQRSRCDLFMKCLPFRVGWPAFRRPKASHAVRARRATRGISGRYRRRW